VAQAAAQDRLDVRLRHGAVGVVVDARPLGSACASPHAQERATLEQGRGPGQRVAAVAVARGVDAARADIDVKRRGGGRSSPMTLAPMRDREPASARRTSTSRF